VLKVVPASLQLLFVGFGLYWTLAGWSVDLVEDRRRLRKIFIAIVGTFVFAMILGERLLIPWQSATLFDVHITLSMVGALLSTVMLWIMFRPDAAAYLDPFRSETVRVAVERPPDDSDLELTVASLAARVAIPEYRLRRAIHERLQYRNFNALLHRYRIEEARAWDAAGSKLAWIARSGTPASPAPGRSSRSTCATSIRISTNASAASPSAVVRQSSLR
jgi:hypothetical protein